MGTDFFFYYERAIIKYIIVFEIRSNDFSGHLAYKSSYKNGNNKM